jgi:anti-sigma factor RsiW
MKTPHLLPKIPDYVLGLLPAEERLQVEQHVTNCVECRQALARERKIATLIRRTVHDTSQPAPARLAALRPDYPVKRTAPTMRVLTQLAPVTLITFLFALGLLLPLTGYNPLQGAYPPTFITPLSTPTVTPTTTRLPTATIAALNGPGSPGAEMNSHSPIADPVKTMDAMSPGKIPSPGSSISTRLTGGQLVSPGSLSPSPNSTPIADPLP